MGLEQRPESAAASCRRRTTETWLPQDHEARYLQSLTHYGRHITLPKGTRLFHQGQIDGRFYVVLSGKVNVHINSKDGDEATLNIMGTGSVIGEAAAILQQPRYSEAWAIEDTELIAFEAARVPSLIAEDPGFAMALLYLLSVKQRQMVARFRQVIFNTPEERVRRFLSDLCVTHGEGDAAIFPMRVGLTQEQIGQLTDLSRVSVARVIIKLKHEGLVEVEGKQLVVLRRLEEPLG